MTRPIKVNPVYRRLLARPPFLLAEVKLYRGSRYNRLNGIHPAVLATCVPILVTLLNLGAPEATKFRTTRLLFAQQCNGLNLLVWLALHLRKKLLKLALMNNLPVIGLQVFLREQDEWKPLW